MANTSKTYRVKRTHDYMRESNLSYGARYLFTELWDQEFDSIVKLGEHSGPHTKDELDRFWNELLECGYVTLNSQENRWDLRLPETTGWGKDD